MKGSFAEVLSCITGVSITSVLQTPPPRRQIFTGALDRVIYDKHTSTAGRSRVRLGEKSE